MQHRVCHCIAKSCWPNVNVPVATYYYLLNNCKRGFMFSPVFVCVRLCVRLLTGLLKNY